MYGKGRTDSFASNSWDGWDGWEGMIRGQDLQERRRRRRAFFSLSYRRLRLAR